MKKAISAILVLFLLIAALAACGKTEETSSSTESIDTLPESSAEPVSQEEQSAEITLNVESKNYGGKEFIIYSTWNSSDYDSEIMESELYGDYNDYLTDNVNEAIAERNRLVEDYLGITIREYFVRSERFGGEAVRQIRANHLSGTLNVHLVSPSIFDMGALAAEGCFADLNAIEGFDARTPWFDQSFIKDAEVYGKLFFIQGDCGLFGFNATPVVFYNKKLAEQYHLPDLYKLVRDGKWTFDAVYTYAKLVSEDLDDNGILDYRDKMGWLGQEGDSWNWFYGSGEKIVDVQNGEMVISMYNERAVGVVEAMNKLFTDRSVYCCANDYFNISSRPVYEVTGKQFHDGRGLFFSEELHLIHLFSDMEDDFGILPIPKYNEEQDDYHSLINSWTGNAFAIPAVLSESEKQFASECLQVFCYFSTDTVKKEYIERTLKYQKTVDGDSVEMLTIAFGTRGTDLGFIYNVGSHGNTSTETSLPWLLQRLMKGDLTFTAGFEARKEAAETDIAEIASMYTGS